MDVVSSFGAALWQVLAEMAPYLLFGFLVAGALAVGVPRSAVERHLGGGGFGAVLKATVFGIPLPLCSCGVIPVAASLRNHGAGRAASTAFLLSTPQTGVDSILVTLSLLGPVFAAFRVAAALAGGLVGGLVVGWAGGRDEGAAPACTEACCAGHEHGGRLRRAVQYGFVTLPADIGPALAAGLGVAAAIAVVVPEDYFAGLLGGGILAMLVMLVAGIPVYVCATASVPVAAALMAKGVSPGAALVFLMTGPATNAVAISALWKMLGRRSALVYLAVVAFGALASGIALDALFTFGQVPTPEEVGEFLPSGVHSASAFVLLALMAGLVVRGVATRLRARAKDRPGTILLSIGGMRCGTCAAMVEEALGSADGVDAVAVRLEEGRAEVRGRGLREPELRKRIEDAGFAGGDDEGSSPHDDHA